MDGVESLDGVIIIAATNQAEVSAPALLRSGRFERVLHVPPPDAGAREVIFNIHSEGMPLSKFSLKDVIGGLDGFTGADIEAVCREAALICMRAGKKKVTKTHFEEAIKRVRPTVTAEVRQIRFSPLAAHLHRRFFDSHALHDGFAPTSSRRAG